MNATKKSKQSMKQSSLASSGQVPNAKGKQSKTRKHRAREDIPLARATIQISNNPNIRKTPLGCIVEHEELLTTLVQGGDTAFQMIGRYRINPGSYKTFPWLSGLSGNFEFYKFRKLHFTYRTRTNATVSGIIMFSPDYDAADGQILENIEAQLYANKGSIESALYKDFTLQMNTATMNRLYKSHTVMSDDRFETTKQDQKTIDAGQLFIGTENALSQGTALGKLIVKYEVEFFQPAAITEKLSLGGHAMSYLTVTAGSGIPLSTAASVNIAQPTLEKLLITGAQMAGITGIPLATHQANLGIFTRDWEGMIASQVAGAGITSSPFFYIGPSTGANDNLTAGSPGDIIQVPALNSNTIINPGATLQSSIHKVSAKKGDRLRMRSNSATSITELSLRMAGVLSQLL